MVLYLPKNTAVLQSMYQGAIATLKAFYFFTTFSQPVETTENDVVTVRAWKLYFNIDCFKTLNPLGMK